MSIDVTKFPTQRSPYDGGRPGSEQSATSIVQSMTPRADRCFAFASKAVLMSRIASPLHSPLAQIGRNCADHLGPRSSAAGLSFTRRLPSRHELPTTNRLHLVLGIRMFGCRRRNRATPSTAIPIERVAHRLRKKSPGAFNAARSRPSSAARSTISLQ